MKGEGYHDIGIITPYKDQVKAVAAQFGQEYEVATVHKFQGREKDAIILTSVDDVIGSFVDNPNMLNVAVSRAVKALVVVMSQDPQTTRQTMEIWRDTSDIITVKLLIVLYSLCLICFIRAMHSNDGNI